MNGTLDAIWASVGYHGVLWLGLLAVIAVFTFALVRDWKDRPSRDTPDRRPRS